MKEILAVIGCISIIIYITNLYKNEFTGRLESVEEKIETLENRLECMGGHKGDAVKTKIGGNWKCSLCGEDINETGR